MAWPIAACARCTAAGSVAADRARVYVSGHQGASGSIGILFGVIGVAAAHAAAQSTGQKKTQDVQTHLRLDLAAATQRVLAEELQRNAATRFVPAGSIADGSIEIVPYLVINFLGDDQVRPWVVLQAVLKDASGGEKWKMRYVVSLGHPRLLTGEAGWTDGGGAVLRSALEGAMRSAVVLLMRDASGTLPRNTGRDVKVRAQWVWFKDYSEWPAEVLEETEDTIVVVPKVADAAASAGVNVFPKKAVEIR